MSKAILEQAKDAFLKCVDTAAEKMSDEQIKAAFFGPSDDEQLKSQ